MTLSIVNKEEINSVRPVRNQKAPRANAIKKLMLFKKPSWGLWDDEIPKNDKLNWIDARIVSSLTLFSLRWERTVVIASTIVASSWI